MAEFNPDDIPSDTAAGNGPGFTGIPPRNNEAALFVGGLSFSATEEDLRSVCFIHLISPKSVPVGLWFCRKYYQRSDCSRSRHWKAERFRVC